MGKSIFCGKIASGPISKLVIVDDSLLYDAKQIVHLLFRVMDNVEGGLMVEHN